MPLTSSLFLSFIISVLLKLPDVKSENILITSRLIYFVIHVLFDKTKMKKKHEYKNEIVF